MREYTQIDNVCYKCGFKKGLKEVKFQNDEVLPDTILHIKLCKECLPIYKKIKDGKELKEWMEITDKAVRFQSNNPEGLFDLLEYFFGDE